MGPVRVSYLRTVGKAEAATWEISVGSVGSVEADDTGSSRLPGPGEGGLAQCREDELWPPQVFAIATALIDEGFKREGGGGGGGGCRRGEVSQGRDREGRRVIFAGGGGGLCIYRV